MQIHVTLLLRDEGLIALGTEELPGADKVLHNVDVGARLDIEVTGIEESADVQAGDEFQRLVFRIGGRPLTVQVEVIALWGLQIALLERLTVPGAIALGHIHVIHVDRHPDVSGGIGDLVVDMGVDEKVICFGVSVLDIIDARFLDSREIEFHIVIFEIRSP